MLIQILTGIGLALVYVPAADKAYDSLLYLNYEQPLGWFLRALHYYAGSGMVVLVLAHMTQVFLHGAYKYPRELTWVVGVFLLALHAGHVFHRPGAALGSRRLLGPGGRRFDGRPRAGHRPVGGAFAAGRTRHRRRFAEPVFCAARVCHSRRAAGLAGRASWLVLKCGVSAPPVPGQIVDPGTYDAEYHEELQTRACRSWAMRCSRTFSSRRWR